MSSSGLTISKLARAADVNVETIRYYQRVGLVTQPDKPSHGYRRYPDETVSKIRFVKRAQRLGFTLKEIEELIKLSEGQFDTAKELAQQKLAIIDEHIADLSAMKVTLQELIDAAEPDQNIQSSPKFNKSCAIIEALTDEKKLKALAENKYAPKPKPRVSNG